MMLRMCLMTPSWGMSQGAKERAKVFKVALTRVLQPPVVLTLTRMG